MGASTARRPRTRPSRRRAAEFSRGIRADLNVNEPSLARHLFALRSHARSRTRKVTSRFLVYRQTNITVVTHARRGRNRTNLRRERLYNLICRRFFSPGRVCARAFTSSCLSLFSNFYPELPAELSAGRSRNGGNIPRTRYIVHRGTFPRGGRSLLVCIEKREGR